MRKSIFIILPAIIITTIVFAQNISNKPGQTIKKRYSHALLYFHDKWDVVGNPQEIFVVGSMVNSDLRTKVTKTKNVYEALELMGMDGWEIETVAIHNINVGEEHIHYLKKETN